MTLEELALKYISKTDGVFRRMRIVQKFKNVNSEDIENIIEEARRYLNDAKYYMEKKKPETSLASVAYCEGLLDALRMLGFVKFSW